MISRRNKEYFIKAVGSENIGKNTETDISARCPVCGDSKRNKRLKRLHLYSKGGLELVHCFNGDCPLNTHKKMYRFLRDHFPALYPYYQNEERQDFIENLKQTRTCADTLAQPKNKEIITQDFSSYFTEISKHQNAIDYLSKRGIEYDPLKFGEWYYGHQNLIIGDKKYNLVDSIIIPLYYRGEMYGFYSRKMKDKFFATYMNDNNIGYKLFNWFNVNKKETVYVTEGIFDAVSLGKNVIASMGSKIPKDRLLELHDPIFCLDSDYTGLKNSLAYAKGGYKIFIKPQSIQGKDLNEIRINYPDMNLLDFVNNNTYTGFCAELRLKQQL